VRQPWYLAPLAAFLPPEALAVAVKDMRIFPRDLRSLQQVIFPLALAAIWSFQLVAGDGEPGTELVESLRRAVGPAAIGFFVCLSLSNALGGPSISREGPGFWMLKVAPVSAWRVLLGKLAVAYLPFPLVGTLLVAALAALQGNGLLELLVALALVLVVGLGASALALGLGAAFPRFNWETPQQQTTLIAGCLTPLLYLGYIGLAAGLSLGPLALGGVWPEYQIPLTATGWVLLLSLTALVTWGSLAFGAARLERVEV
jgi:ABC-2 type transport system permease protein